MRLNKHYMFDVTEEHAPYVTLYNNRPEYRTTLGIWQMDVGKGIEFRIEMTPQQAEHMANDIILELTKLERQDEDNQQA